MTILCIETSTNVCSAAVTIGGVVIAERICSDGANHAQRLPVFIDELIQEVTAKGLKIEAVALSEGPGSYTGLRIGTSMAKGLCFGWNVPLIPVQTLQVMCVGAVSSLQEEIKCDNVRLCPMIDARRMEVYTASYDKELLLQGDVHAKIVDTEDWIPEGEVFFFGDGASKCFDIVANSAQANRVHYVENIVPEAKYMGVLAERLFEERKALNGVEIAYYEPFYLKEFVAAPSHVKGLTK